MIDDASRKVLTEMGILVLSDKVLKQLAKRELTSISTIKLSELAIES